ncbi:TetR family transcriptional regulator [Pokkaliibacter sp. CJK22405]|uniref:TetR family transcriptional regulator n=1 Tax=Pokkaliibacter sp. CJK22405 TaxID=3384615 RepID=UPI0039851ED2
MSEKPLINIRARSAAGKAARRESILQAAESLFSANPTVLPTIAEISDACSLAKGTIYIYFPSKEAIFLTLLEESILKWTAEMRRTALEAKAAPAVLEVLCDHVNAHPRLMQLACLSNGVLEPNVSDDLLVHFKQTLCDDFHLTAREMRDLFPDQRQEQTIVQTLLQSYALLIGLWQLAHPTHSARGVESPTLETLRPPFEPTAREALNRLWGAAA